VGEGTQIAGHRVLAGGAPNDPLVVALAQLVRDRWAAEQSERDQPVALRTVPRNMVTMTIQPSSLEEHRA